MTRRIRLLSLVVTALWAAIAPSARALPGQFVDPEDGKFDMSQYLASRYGFLPVPMIITEPAVGYGGGLALGYFHALKELDPSEHPHSGPPAITMALGALTSNGTWMAGAGHRGTWFHDHVRYTGFAAFFHPVLDWYGVDLPDDANGIQWESDTWLLYQGLQFRAGESNWWLGMDYVYSNSEIEFDSGDELPQSVPALAFDVDTGGAGLRVEFDNRNSTFTPTRGTRVQFGTRFYGDWAGGDDDYTSYRLHANQHFALGRYSSVGVRLLAETIGGRAPFYAYPFVQLRGVPAMRYQGQWAWSGEAEVLWGVTPRWTLVGFGGLGYVTAEVGSNDETVPAGGTGFRYRLARLFDLQGGVDFAWGPEDFAFYITVGNAWN
jgi:hypothetical protein